MGARPPKYDWPIKWPEPDDVPQWVLSGILCVAGLLILLFLALVAKFIGAIVLNEDPKNVQALGLTILAIVGVPFAIWRTIVAQGNLDRSKDRDYADLFTKAVEQLGATREVREWDEETKRDVYRHEPNIEVRLGAIYALERISQDSERDHIAVMETLCAYVRENSPVETSSGPPIEFLPSAELHNNDVEIDWELAARWWELCEYALLEWLESHSGPRADIQAAISVLGRRSAERIEYECDSKRNGRNFRIDLTSANLQLLNFENGSFQNADFAFSHLDAASFNGTDLYGADFSKIRAFLASFRARSLVEADFWEAQIAFSDFKNTKLAWTKFVDANLASSKMLRIEADHTKFSGANLECCDFSRARIADCNVISSRMDAVNFTDARLSNLSLFLGNLFCANLQGATLKNVDLQFAEVGSINASCADLVEVTNLSSEALDFFFGCAGTKLPSIIEDARPHHWHDKKLSRPEAGWLGPDSLVYPNWLNDFGGRRLRQVKTLD